MIRRVIVLMLFGLLAWAAYAQNATDEHAVITGSLQQLVRIRRPDLRAGFLVASETSSDLAPETSDDPPVKGIAGAWSDYCARNATTIPIQASGLPDPARIARINRKGPSYNWREIAARYPGTTLIVDMSRPWFQDQGRTAVIRYDVISVDGTVTRAVSVFRRSSEGSSETAFYFPVGKAVPPN